MKILNKINEVDLKKYAPVVLRLSMAFVFIWFGMNQLMNTAQWVGLIPDWVVSFSGLSAETMVKLNGTFEIIASILLAIGFQTRIVATLLALHMLTIVMKLGFVGNGIRDIGLMFACLSIALHGADDYTYDRVSLFNFLK